MKFALIDAEKATCPVATACEALGVSRPGYYAWRRRPESRRAREDRRLSLKVRESFQLGRTYYGSPRILKDLKAKNEHVSRKRVIRLMQEHGLVARVRRRYKSTTMSDHDQPVAPNLLAQNTLVSSPRSLFFAHRWSVPGCSMAGTFEGQLHHPDLEPDFPRQPLNDHEGTRMNTRSAIRTSKSWLGLASLVMMAASCGAPAADQGDSPEAVEPSPSELSVGTVVGYEAEALTRTASIGTNVASEASASGGQYVQFSGTPAVGSWVQFSFSVAEPGTYALKYLFKSNTNRGIVQASIDGVNQGATCNEYAPGAAFKVACNLGSKSLTAGTHLIRFTVTGKSSSSSGYQVVVDQLSLTAAAARSAGCGKAPTLSSGKRTITSSGTQRTYIVDVPTNYDPNHAYRVFFGFHWINATADQVANGEVASGGPSNFAYFGTKRQATNANDPAIFIAPQSNTGIWGQPDHVLFDDILAVVKGGLCVDTSRVFAEGFSFGAMMTYSLSTNHQSTIRAALGISPANYNIYLPTKTHQPIAWMSTTGMSDGTTPWDLGNGRGAKYIAIEHAQDNGCTIPATIPTTTAGSKTHLCYDFQGCMAGYPVKACTFDGTHQMAPYDGGSGDNGTTTWIPVEFWKFISKL